MSIPTLPLRQAQGEFFLWTIPVFRVVVHAVIVSMQRPLAEISEGDSRNIMRGKTEDYAPGMLRLRGCMTRCSRKIKSPVSAAPYSSIHTRCASLHKWGKKAVKSASNAARWSKKKPLSPSISSPAGKRWLKRASTQSSPSREQ